MLPPSNGRHRGKSLGATCALAMLALGACDADNQANVPIVISPEAVTILGQDTLGGIFVDVSELNGGAAYLSTTDPFITLINRSGAVTRQFGIGGEGPGEFRNPTSIDVQADTIYVWDVRQGAASMYDTVGNYLGRRRGNASFGGVQKNARTNYAGRPGMYRRFGSLAVTAAYPNGVGMPGEERAYSLLALDDSGEVVDTTWTSSLPPSANERAPKQPAELLPIPVWAKCSNAQLVVYDPNLSVSFLRTPEGKEFRQIPSGAEPVEISNAGLHGYVSFNFRRLLLDAHQAPPISFDEDMTKWVQQAEAMGLYPKEYNGYTSVLCTRRGEVWLNAFSLEDSPLGYSRDWILVSEGPNRRLLSLPNGFRLMLLTEKRGYGVVMDSTTAESPAWVEFSE